MEQHGFGDSSSWNGEAFYWIWQPESQGKWKQAHCNYLVLVPLVVDCCVQGIGAPPVSRSTDLNKWLLRAYLIHRYINLIYSKEFILILMFLVHCLLQGSHVKGFIRFSEKRVTFSPLEILMSGLFLVIIGKINSSTALSQIVLIWLQNTLNINTCELICGREWKEDMLEI